MLNPALLALPTASHLGLAQGDWCCLNEQLLCICCYPQSSVLSCNIQCWLTSPVAALERCSSACAMYGGGRGGNGCPHCLKTMTIGNAILWREKHLHWGVCFAVCLGLFSAMCHKKGKAPLCCPKQSMCMKHSRSSKRLFTFTHLSKSKKAPST